MVSPPAALREAVAAALQAMPTSLAQDERTLERVAVGGDLSGDPRACAVVAYRVQRKQQLRLAELILETYLSTPP